MKDISKINKSNVSRSKAHERTVAKLLKEWSGREFRRRRVTGRDHQTTAVDLCADVIPVNDPFLFSVEAKCGADYSAEALLSSPLSCRFTKWWHQTCYDTQLMCQLLKRSLLPMLFFRPKPSINWVAVSGHAFSILEPKPDIYRSTHSTINHTCWFPHFLYDAYGWIGPIAHNVSHGRKDKSLVKLQLDPVVICTWNDFAAAVDPDQAFNPGGE